MSSIISCSVLQTSLPKRLLVGIHGRLGALEFHYELDDFGRLKYMIQVALGHSMCQCQRGTALIDNPIKSINSWKCGAPYTKSRSRYVVIAEHSTERYKHVLEETDFAMFSEMT